MGPLGGNPKGREGVEKEEVGLILGLGFRRTRVCGWSGEGALGSLCKVKGRGHRWDSLRWESLS